MARVISSMKKCNDCLVLQPFERFSKDSFKPDGLRTICRACRKARRKSQETSDSKKRDSDSKKRWYQNNKTRVLKLRADYYQANRIEHLKKGKIRKKARLKTDPAFRILENCRNRLGLAVKSKSGNTLSLIGCSGQKLKSYLESKFLTGMDWGNYGIRGWHIDHIMPCSRFDLSLPEEQRKCFHFTNLQPLWAKDNFAKGSK